MKFHQTSIFTLFTFTQTRISSLFMLKLRFWVIFRRIFFTTPNISLYQGSVMLWGSHFWIFARSAQGVFIFFPEVLLLGGSWIGGGSQLRGWKKKWAGRKKAALDYLPGGNWACFQKIDIAQVIPKTTNLGTKSTRELEKWAYSHFQSFSEIIRNCPVIFWATLGYLVAFWSISFLYGLFFFSFFLPLWIVFAPPHFWVENCGPFWDNFMTEWATNGWPSMSEYDQAPSTMQGDARQCRNLEANGGAPMQGDAEIFLTVFRVVFF